MILIKLYFFKKYAKINDLLNKTKKCNKNA